VPRRTIAAIAAIVLAILGSALLVGWVSGAERRAQAGLDPVDVLVVSEPVAQGTAAEDLVRQVTTATLPAAAVAEGALENLKEVEGLVTTADLLPGEQLLAARFADPEALNASGQVDVPDGLHQISLVLEPQRALGGRLTPGSTVAVFASFSSPEQTNLILHKVLVTSVQGAAAAEPAEGEEGAQPLPEGAVMVSLAVSPGQAERILFAAEHGTIWLSNEPEGAPEGGTSVRSRENIYQ
jgi:pilus assembly protein CpaB